MNALYGYPGNDWSSNSADDHLRWTLARQPVCPGGPGQHSPCRIPSSIAEPPRCDSLACYPLRDHPRAEGDAQHDPLCRGHLAGGLDVGYRVMFGGGLMANMNRHPDRVIYSPAMQVQLRVLTSSCLSPESAKRSIGVQGFGPAQDQGTFFDRAA